MDSGQTTAKWSGSNAIHVFDGKAKAFSSFEIFRLVLIINVMVYVYVVYSAFENAFNPKLLFIVVVDPKTQINLFLFLMGDFGINFGPNIPLHVKNAHEICCIWNEQNGEIGECTKKIIVNKL